MTSHRVLHRVLMCAALVAATSCGNTFLGDGERKLTLRDLAMEVILPTTQDVATRSAALRDAAVALADQPSGDALVAARQAWRAAREPWTEAEAFPFGPATELRLGVAIDQWPIEAARIEDEIAGVADLSVSYVAALGANKKGFHALEHLLFEGDVMTALAGSPRRRQYLRAVAEVLARDTTSLAAAWRDDYGERFADPGDDGGVFATVQAAVDTLINESVTITETVAEKRIGKPAGNETGGTPQPDFVESAASDQAAADLVGNLRGVRKMYVGQGGRGLSAIVVARSPGIDAHVRAALDDAERLVAAVPRPFTAALASDAASVQAAYAAVKELEVVLRSEVIGVLGAHVKFNGNDGD